MSSLIKYLFLLPPVEKRRDISRSWVNPVFNGRMTKFNDDCYVYWRCYVISAFVCFSYVVLYQLNYFLNLGLPVQFVHDYDPVRNFSYSYSLMSIPLTLFIMGYGLISLIANLDLKTFDLTWWEPQVGRHRLFIKKGEKSARRVVYARCFVLIIGLIGWGLGSTIVLSYYDSFAYSERYLITHGFILSVLSVIGYPSLPQSVALYYQIRKGWFWSVITPPSNP